jgi:dihydroorotase
LENKKITAEACVHHLHFSEENYAELGAKIKCNPAIKNISDREAIWKALLEDRIDIIATDHAPHTLEEKSRPYFEAPAGLPLVQHSLDLVYEEVRKGRLSMEKLVEKMCHAPAQCFKVNERGFLREGYHADVVIFDAENDWVVNKENILYKCGWSPLEGHAFKGKVTHTFVSGHLAYENGQFNRSKMGQRLSFN